MERRQAATARSFHRSAWPLLDTPSAMWSQLDLLGLCLSGYSRIITQIPGFGTSPGFWFQDSYGDLDSLHSPTILVFPCTFVSRYDHMYIFFLVIYIRSLRSHTRPDRGKPALQLTPTHWSKSYEFRRERVLGDDIYASRKYIWLIESIYKCDEGHWDRRSLYQKRTYSRIFLLALSCLCTPYRDHVGRYWNTALANLVDHGTECFAVVIEKLFCSLACARHKYWSWT